jgi:hypothetical protein
VTGARPASAAGAAPGGPALIGTGQGDAHVLIDRPGGAPRFLLALTHGAGGGVETADLLAVRDAALALGGSVARILQPYQVRGARSPGSPARQDAAWLTVVSVLREEFADGPLVQGGRSNGARLACRTAGQVGARAVIALAFPLHPPGRPERSRRDELRMAAAAGADVLVVNGSRDPFGVPGPADAGGADTRGTGAGGARDGGGRAGTARIVVLEGEGHALSRSPAAVGAAVSSWLGGLLGRMPSGGGVRRTGR